LWCVHARSAFDHHQFSFQAHTVVSQCNMSASRRLRPWARHFAQACAQLRVRAAVQTSAAAAVEKRYSEPHRHYHTLDHLDEMCSLLERHEAAIIDYPAVVMVSICSHFVTCAIVCSREVVGMSHVLRSVPRNCAQCVPWCGVV
jgi:hypothetical protein